MNSQAPIKQAASSWVVMVRFDNPHQAREFAHRLECLREYIPPRDEDANILAALMQTPPRHPVTVDKGE